MINLIISVSHFLSLFLLFSSLILQEFMIYAFSVTDFFQSPIQDVSKFPTILREDARLYHPRDVSYRYIVETPFNLTYTILCELFAVDVKRVFLLLNSFEGA